MVVIMALVAFFNDTATTEIYTKTSYMDWVERLPASSKTFVEESGPIFSGVVDATFQPIKNLFGRLDAEGFVGPISYKGAYISFSDSHAVPYNAVTARLGETLEGTAEYKITVGGNLSVSPFASLGSSVWWRPLCKETWTAGYGKLGASVAIGKFFAKSGLLIPLFTQNDCNLWDFYPVLGRLTDAVTHPKGIPTPFVEAGVQFTGFSIRISYELKEWEKSDEVDMGNGWYIYQPKTTYSSIGLSMDWLL